MLGLNEYELYQVKMVLNANDHASLCTSAILLDFSLLKLKIIEHSLNTVIVLNFRTDRSGQTVCFSICIF